MVSYDVEQRISIPELWAHTWIIGDSSNLAPEQHVRSRVEDIQVRTPLLVKYLLYYDVTNPFTSQVPPLL